MIAQVLMDFLAHASASLVVPLALTLLIASVIPSEAESPRVKGDGIRYSL